MADQKFNCETNRFWIDLHKVGVTEAEKAIKKRLDECLKYGIEWLKIVYGTPDHYHGSIAEALHRTIQNGVPINPSSVPIRFWSDPEGFATQNPFVELSISLFSEDGRRNQHVNMGFSPFHAEYEKDPWKRALCEHWFYPLREWFGISEVGLRLGDHCGPAELESLVTGLPDSFVKRRKSGDLETVNREALPDLFARWREYRIAHPHQKPAKAQGGPKLGKQREVGRVPAVGTSPAAISQPFIPSIPERNLPTPSAQLPEERHQAAPSPKPVVAFTRASCDDWRRLTNDGIDCLQRGDYSAAMGLFRPAEVLAQHLGWRFHYVSLCNLGYLCEITDDMSEAERYFRQAVAISEANCMKDHNLVRSANLSLCLVQGRSIEELIPTAAKPDPSWLASPQAEVEYYCRIASKAESGRLMDLAQEFLTRAIKIAREHKLQPIFEAYALSAITSLSRQRGNYSEAVGYAREALPACNAAMPAAQAIWIDLHLHLAFCLRELDQLHEAASEYRTVLSCVDNIHPAITALATTHLGNCLRKEEKFNEAAALHRKAVELEVERGDPESWIVALATSNLGVTLAYSGRNLEAERAYLRSLELTRNLYGRKDAETAGRLANLGMLYLHWGKLHKARQYLSNSLEIRRVVREPNHPDIAQSTFGLARVYLEEGNLPAARVLATEAIRIRSERIGEDHPSTQRAKAVLAEIERRQNLKGSSRR